MQLLNRYGFIVFNSTGPEPADLLDLPPNGFNPLCASVLLVPGETYKFYLPFSALVAPDSGRISLVHSHTRATLIASIGGVAQVDVGTLRHYKVEITIPSNAAATLPDGYYRLGISLTSGVKIFSNRLWLNKSNYAGISTIFSYRNRRPIGPIAYDLEEMALFRNILRLKCSFGRIDSETNIEDYERITTGQKTTVLTKTHSFVPVSTGYTDAIGAEGWRTLASHKDILINGRPYSIKTGYTNGDGANSLGIGSLELWDSEYSIVNRC